MLYGELQEHKLESGALQGIKVQIKHPKKSAIVRIPTSQEFDALIKKYADRAKKKSQTDRKPHLELFNAIRLDQGESFDEYEAEFVLDWLWSARVQSAEQQGEEFVVTIKTPFCDVQHFMNFPSYKQLATTTKSSALYDALAIKQEGYQEGFDIPSNHKALVVDEIVKDHNSIDPLMPDPNE